jgi:hypothetical protein
MNLRVLVLLIAVIALAAAACTDAAKPPVAVNNAKPTPARPAPGTDEHGHAAGKDSPRITLADAKKDFDEGTAVFIDTHMPEQYEQRHIKGSINVPANNMEPYLNKIPKGKKIIAYCS